MKDIRKMLKSTKLYHGLKNYSDLYKGCSNLEEVDLTKIHNPEIIENTDNMFKDCVRLRKLDLSNLDTKNIKSSNDMFLGIPKINNEGWNFDGENYKDFSLLEETTGYKTITDDKKKVFPWNGDTYLEYTLISNESSDPISSHLPTFLSIDADAEVRRMCKFILHDGTITINSSTAMKDVDKVRIYYFSDDYYSINFRDLANIVSVDYLDVNEYWTDANNLFNGCTNLTSVNTENWDTRNITAMRSMFYNCTSLTSVDVSNFDTSNVTDMGYMFANCSSLTNIITSFFDTSKVCEMDNMFNSCTALTTIDATSWDTSNVTSMAYMFYNCTSLETLNTANFDTSKVTNMQSLFSNCSKLIAIDVSDWDTRNVTNMARMFQNCY